MSHSYYYISYGETEEERRQRLLKEKMERVKRQLAEMRSFISQKKKETADGQPTNNLFTTNSISLINYSTINDTVESNDNNTDIDKNRFKSKGSGRERLDFSKYLEEIIEDEQIIRMNNVLQRIDERIPDSDKAREDLKRLNVYITNLLENKSIDIEDKINLIDQRITMYLENSNYDNTDLDEDLLFDYKALCILLGYDEEFISPEQLKDKVDKMLNEYMSTSQDLVVSDTIQEIINELGMVTTETCVLDNQHKGELLGNDADCKAFVVCNENGLMIEPVNTNMNADSDKVMEGQKKVCEFEKAIIQKALEKGINIRKAYSEELEYDEIATGQDLSDRKVIDENVVVKSVVEKLELERERNRRRRRQGTRRFEENQKEMYNE